ncbi:MAG: twin-arginine translocation pathway signal [Mycobacteriaceae bacterium]
MKLRRDSASSETSAEYQPEASSDAPESAAAQPEPGPAGRRRLHVILGGAYAAVVLALVVAVGVLLVLNTTGWPLHPKLTSDAVDQARTDGLRAANDDVVALLSYDFKTVDDELKKARESLTGPFLDDYTKLTTTVVAPAAKDQNITTKATVVGSAVVSAEPTHVVALLFINQSTTTKTAPEASSSGSRVTLTMDKVGDRWLVSALSPV